MRHGSNELVSDVSGGNGFPASRGTSDDDGFAGGSVDDGSKDRPDVREFGILGAGGFSGRTRPPMHVSPESYSLHGSVTG